MSYGIKGQDGTAALPGWTFANDVDTGVYRIGANNLGIACGGAKVVDVAAAGVGVTGTLGVTGLATFGADLLMSASTGVVRPDTSDGSDSKALIVAGAGAGSVSRGAAIALYGNEHATQPGNLIIQPGEAGVTRFNCGASGAEAGRITAGGVLAIGTTVTAGSAAGDLVLGNTRQIRGVNAGGTGTGPIAAIGASNQLILGTGLAVSVGAHTVTTAGPDDLVLGNARALRWANAAGTSAISALSLGTDNHLYVAQNLTSAVAIGSPASLAGATSGDVVLANAKALRGVNAAGTTTVPLITLDPTNQTTLGLNTAALAFTNAIVHGSAGAVAGYIEVVVNGTTRKIPYHAA